MEIRLPGGLWIYDESKPLGQPGGFGAVFAGHSDKHGPIAVKKLHLGAGDAAHREMEVAADLAGKDFEHVMSVFDAGEDAEGGGYFVVMLRAEKSLQDELDSGKTFEGVEAVQVLLGIATGLGEVPHIVHRDLKPGNVLLHEGSWKIADFGIARFVEESTSLRTLKDCLSAPYAAPEQWRFERASSATDIYALGCIGYALLTGRPPFNGPDYRKQHLEERPPALAEQEPTLQSLLTMMLRKVPEARPQRARVVHLLQRTDKLKDSSNSVALGELAKAGARVAKQEAERERQASVAAAELEARERLAKEGITILKEIEERLVERVLAVAPPADTWEATSSRFLDNREVGLGQGTLTLGFSDEVLGAALFEPANWDVVTCGVIMVTQSQPEYQWSSSLWFGKLAEDGDYRWHEVSYFNLGTNIFESLGTNFEPYALSGLDERRHAVLAASPAVHTHQIAWGPVAIDGEDADAFIKRWSFLLAKGSQGQLEHPSHLPLRPDFFG